MAALDKSVLGKSGQQDSLSWFAPDSQQVCVQGSWQAQVQDVERLLDSWIGQHRD